MGQLTTMMIIHQSRGNRMDKDFNASDNIIDGHSQANCLAACYRIIHEAARKKRVRDEKEPTVRGKFGDQTQTAEEGAATEKSSARQL